MGKERQTAKDLLTEDPTKPGGGTAVPYTPTQPAQPTNEEDDNNKKKVYVAPKTTAAAKKYDTTRPNVFVDTTDPELRAQYDNAMAALEGMKGQAPVYGSQYDAQIQSLYQQILGRDKFKYDSKTDPLYQQYVQDYTTQGKMAMRDTMGQAAALTGGYGSSYAQSVGQQQYDHYLQKMADILPETYGMALDAWKAEGDLLNSKMDTTRSLEQSDYNRYLDELGQYNTDLDRARSDVDTWYNRMSDKEKETYNRQIDQYQMQKDYYNQLVSLIAAGYTPSKSDYNAAGLSQAQGEALRAQYAPKKSTGGRRTSTVSKVSDDDLKKEYEALINGGNAAGQTVIDPFTGLPVKK